MKKMPQEQVRSTQTVIRARFESILDTVEVQDLVNYIARDHHIRIIEVDPDLTNRIAMVMFGGREAHVLRVFGESLDFWQGYQASSETASRARCRARISPLSLARLGAVYNRALKVLPGPIRAGFQIRRAGGLPEPPAQPLPGTPGKMDLKILVSPFPVLFAIVLATEDLPSVETLLAAFTSFQGEVSQDINPMALYSLRREYQSVYQKLSRLSTLIDDVSLTRHIRVVCRIDDYRRLPLATVYSELNEIFRPFALRVAGCQILGYLPLEALLSSLKVLYPGDAPIHRAPLGTKLDILLKRLHLSEVEPFAMSRQILDFLLQPELVQEIYASGAN
ncbi:MAG: hypothetical protein D6715_13420 [Calditrichaeota bacterium]|nr:MAG: hypothetical protein D6715_13420 [Calditrichota bacterium]